MFRINTPAKFAVILLIAMPGLSLAQVNQSNLSLQIQEKNFASNMNHRFAVPGDSHLKSFGVWGIILDMGSSANGSHKNSTAKHQAWCARLHKSYDANSNTYRSFSGSNQTCYSPYLSALRKKQ